MLKQIQRRGPFARPAAQPNPTLMLPLGFLVAFGGPWAFLTLFHFPSWLALVISLVAQFGAMITLWLHSFLDLLHSEGDSVGQADYDDAE